MNKLFLPYDLFERHKKIGSFIKDDESVVDVGGELNHLSQFCKPSNITVANLKTGDVIISKDKLPFKNNSFDIVCSIDVLEHIPKGKREEFINRLYKTANKKVLLSFPIGTEKHVIYEKKIENWLQKKGGSVSYLKEHIKLGLPDNNEIKKITESYKTTIYYSGNILFNEILFKIFMFDPKVKYLRKIIYLLKLLFNAITNNLFYLVLSNKKYSNNINRAYIQITKEK